MAELFTRNGNDLTSKLKTVPAAVQKPFVASGLTSPAQIVRERAERPVGLVPETAAPVAGRPRTSVKVTTNSDRVIDPSTGFKKVDLVRYYESIADWMLPHLKDRPVSLVRAPEGIAGEKFFQKHPETKMPGMGRRSVALVDTRGPRRD